MTDPRYLIPRVMRHFLPEPAAAWLLERGWIIKPGLETYSPQQAAERYISHLKDHQLALKNKRVMVFGYGGNFGIAPRLLGAGAKHVVLIEREGFPQKTNLKEASIEFPHLFITQSYEVKINTDLISVFHADINTLAKVKALPAVDLVLTSSVYEHLEQPEMVTRSLAQLTKRSGSQLHFIDLRDHFFKYPFEMFCYSPSAWKHWLNPTSHLNRYRIQDYMVLFKKHFSSVNFTTEASDYPTFIQYKDRMRPEFLSGNDEVDSITQICLVASQPLSGVD